MKTQNLKNMFQSASFWKLYRYRENSDVMCMPIMCSFCHVMFLYKVTSPTTGPA